MRIHLSSVLVDDQEKALRFYTEVLGFVKKTDVPMGEFRWLTVVSPESREGTELVLEPDAHAAAKPFKSALVADGIPFTSFAVADVNAEYDRLRAAGVRFTQPPTDFGPVTTAVFDDTCGNLVQIAAQKTDVSQAATTSFVQDVHGVRYQVKDVARSVAFYTQLLGFALEREQVPAFASVSLGGTRLLLSGPGASGSRPMPNGQRQEPGGWNRVVLKVADLPAVIAELKKAGVRFRNEMESGPGGRQIQIEDADGNPVELFEPAR